MARQRLQGRRLLVDFLHMSDHQHPLQAFAALTEPIALSAGLTLDKNQLVLTYALKDPQHLVHDSLVAGEWFSWPRGDELWKSTCFEAFFGIAGHSSYWELNLSPSRKAWNLYFFDEYRKPAPPRVAKDFQLVDVLVRPESLSCVLRSEGNLGLMAASLAAVIRTAGGVFYFALKHCGPKPDFHLRESFVLSLDPGEQR